MKAKVTHIGLFDMQVCVPENWSDEQATKYAQAENPCGTTNGWILRAKEDECPDYQKRVSCEKRNGYVHIMFDA